MKQLSLIVISTVVFAAFALAHASAEQLKGAAAVTSASGDVDKKQPGGEWAAAKTNDIIEPGGSIRTGVNSKAKIVLPNGSVIVVGPLSVFTIQTMGLDYGTSSSSSGFSLETGSARAVVTKSNKGTSTFTISTPTAVAGVRGTDFAVELDIDLNTTVTVFDGEVEVASALAAISEKILVTKDQAAQILKDKAPNLPKNIDKDTIKKKILELSRNKEDDAPNKADEMIEAKARGMVIAHVNNLTDEEKDKLIRNIQDGNITGDQAEKIVSSVQKNVKKDLLGRALDAVASKNISPEEKEKIVGLMDKGAAADVIKNALDNIGKPRVPEMDTDEKAKLDELRDLDKAKVDAALDKLGPDDPARKELMLIKNALDKGIPREKLAILLGAYKKGLIDEKEALIIVSALARGVDPKQFFVAVQSVNALKPDAKIRALIFKAVASGLDLKELLDKIKDTGLTPQQAIQRLEEIIKNRLQTTTLTAPSTGGGK